MVYVSRSWLRSMNSTWPQDPAGDPEDLRPLVWWCSDSMLHWIRRECSGCCNGCGSRPGHELDQSRLLAKHSWCLDVFNMFSWFVLCCLLALCILMLVAVLAMPVWCTLELRKQWYQNIVRAVAGHMMMSYWAELLCALCMPMWNGCLLHVLPLGLDLLYVNWEMASRRSLPAKVAKSKKRILCICPVGLLLVQWCSQWWRDLTSSMCIGCRAWCGTQALLFVIYRVFHNNEQGWHLMVLMSTFAVEAVHCAGLASCFQNDK